MNLIRQLCLYFLYLIDITVTEASTSLLADRKYCGYQHTDDYIRTRENISIDEFPWMAQLLYDKDLRIKCSGSLISKRYVLTAAHCLNPRSNTLVKVRLGDYNVKTDQDCTEYKDYGTECTEPVEHFDVEEKIEHPSFKLNGYHHDIGLIRLSSNVLYSDFIRPICLPRKNSPDLQIEEELATSGWGTLGAGLPATDLKKRIITNLISIDSCSEIYKNTGMVINNNHLCTVEKKELTCAGDSGAPLMYSVRNQWEEVGVLSFGIGCGSKYPSVHIKVSNYLDWIEETLRG